MTEIPGYALGAHSLPRSPVTLAALRELMASLTLGEADLAALRRSLDLLVPRVEEVLDVWYGFVGSQPHLLRHFSDAVGQPDGNYLARVRARFGQWIIDTARARFDEEWLAWQDEIGRRHHRVGKNRTDGAQSTPLVPMSHLIALVHPVTATLRPFLEAGGHAREEVDAMHDAWRKAVLLTVILWSRPYVPAEDF